MKLSYALTLLLASQAVATMRYCGCYKRNLSTGSLDFDQDDTWATCDYKDGVRARGFCKIDIGEDEWTRVSKTGFLFIRFANNFVGLRLHWQVHCG
ncbi:hypothetical protein LZ30DRAFT_742090 [Colletotrichum cereale]|nr:hypothetical protein LZ30DRAFT_742090 [Colletotrichum cereale]